MKSKKLLEKLNTLLGIGADADKEHIKMLRKVLLTLKEKQATLQARLEEPQSDHERRKTKQKIEVIQRQREKGVEAYKAMKGWRQVESGKDGESSQT